MMMMMTTRDSSSSSSSSLVLDSEKGEIVRALMRPATSIFHHNHNQLMNQKSAKADKALIALRNHSDAERRRRERINGHLAVLRTLVPGTNKVNLVFL